MRENLALFQAVTLVVIAIAFVVIISTQSAPAQTFTVLHSFDGTDGLELNTILLDNSGSNLYGTALFKGPYNCNPVFEGCGTVFKLSHRNSAGIFSLAYAFGSGENDGYLPAGQMVQDASGILYGTTQYGGRLWRWYPFRAQTLPDAAL